MKIASLLLALCLLPACGTTTSSDMPADMAPAAPDMAEMVSGSCAYKNPFSMGDECREYVGSGWTAVTAGADCKAQQGAYNGTGRCATTSVLGRCVLGDGTDKVTRVLINGTDAAQCASNKMGCETFAGGLWAPAVICGGK